MMGGIQIEDFIVLQAEMVCMEGMIEALIKGAYNGTKLEYIGNSLEVLRDYLGRRADKLDGLIRVLTEGGA